MMTDAAEIVDLTDARADRAGRDILRDLRDAQSDVLATIDAVKRALDGTDLAEAQCVAAVRVLATHAASFRALRRLAIENLENAATSLTAINGYLERLETERPDASGN